MDEQKEAVTIPKKYIYVTIIILLILAVAVIAYKLGSQKTQNDDKSQITGGFIGVEDKQVCPFECCMNDGDYENRVCQGNYNCVNNKCKKTDCPYECCLEGEFSAKQCLSDYECKSNVCSPIDSDKDGITDVDERQSGSNPFAYDSDSDGLNDYQEKQLRTNPNNQNSDNDRYKDSEDQDPITKNSASISLSITDKSFNVNWLNVGIAFIGGGVINPDMTVAEPVVIIKVENKGTDYSSYLNYDIVFYIADTEMTRFPVNKGKVDLHSQQTETRSFEIKANDVPSILINMITKESSQWNVQIQNVNYEKFQ